jgi:hypothetical protein
MPTDEVLAIARSVAKEQKFFHWELEFPDVFTPERKGFDANLGNPPWEIQKPNSKEFFSNIDPLYRAYGKQEALAKQVEYFQLRQEDEEDWLRYCADLKARSNWIKYVGHPFGDDIWIDSNGNKKHDLNLGGRGRDSFSESERLHKKWRERRSKHVSFSDTRHPFLHQGSADLNTYKMFLEQSHALLREGGRLGMIVPSGVYTDKGTTALRELFLGHCDWQWLFGFENREKIFDIDSRFKFCPLVVQKGGVTVAIRAAFMHRNVDDWEHAERHVLAYPRERVEEFSPYSKAIMEIRVDQELRVLQRIYANGVLLGDKSEHGWGIKYATEFHMTNDSKLFPELPKWEAKEYFPDEYGHWLKGAWQEYSGQGHILERQRGLILSRDGRQAIHVDQVEDVALPLYEGRMINQFDFSEKGWVSGKGRSAVWRDISFENKVIEPQYLMALETYLDAIGKSSNSISGLKAGFLAIGSATNSRSMFSGLVANYPAGNSVAILQSKDKINTIALMSVLNSFSYDFSLRNRLGGLNLNYFVLAETPLIRCEPNAIKLFARNGARLCLPNIAFSPEWLEMKVDNTSWYKLFALSLYERMRIKIINEALAAHQFGLSPTEFMVVLDSCDFPSEVLTNEYTKALNPKGFWRTDKEKSPEMRYTVLSLIAFQDLHSKGLDAFLNQNNGEGWMIPETVRLADYGLGHDDRALEYQPVASRLGPRFYDWQLSEDIKRSWEECEAHAELIRKIVPIQTPEELNTDEAPTSPAAPSSQQMDLF